MTRMSLGRSRLPGGAVEFRVEKAVSSGAGKVSFDTKALEENVRAADAVIKAKLTGAGRALCQARRPFVDDGSGLKVDLSSLTVA